MNEEKKSDNRGRGLYLLLILLLLCLNGWLFYNAYQNKDERAKSALLIQQGQELYGKLQSQYDEAKKELSAQKGDFHQKDSLIAALDAELDSRRNEIATLLKTCNFFNGNSQTTQKKLNQISVDVKDLGEDCSSYKRQLEELNAKFLALQKDYEELQFEYEKEVRENENLKFNRDSILEIGGFILSQDITITGVRKKGNGGDAEGQNSAHTDRLKICFDLLPNKLSAGKDQTFFVKIIGPNGKTLYDEKNGSGEFVNKEKPDDKLFSKAVNIKYDGASIESHCTYWEQAEFKPGTYTVKIYHNGYMSSRATFTLKKPVVESVMDRIKGN